MCRPVTVDKNRPFSKLSYPFLDMYQHKQNREKGRYKAQKMFTEDSPKCQLVKMQHTFIRDSVYDLVLHKGPFFV